ncbi:MAG: hypothetical protein DSY47_00045 [Hydrogenothermus sp.]|nr:MAG: hypothetical protein DSY47_00045 [Hydrogenothermus sp.]
MENIGQRIKQLRKMLGLSQREFAEKIGKSLNAVQKWESGDRIPSEPALKLIAKEFNVNEEWLKTGEGEMFAGVPQLQTSMHFQKSFKEYFQVSFYDIYASAGNGVEAIESEPKPIQIDRLFAQAILGISSGNGLFMIQAYGDSMYPTIKPGDYLIGKFYEYENFLLEGSIYVFRIGNELFVKRFKKDRKGNKLIFKSDNPEYNDIEITEDQQAEIKIIGRILVNLSKL